MNIKMNPFFCIKVFNNLPPSINSLTDKIKQCTKLSTCSFRLLCT